MTSTVNKLSRKQLAAFLPSQEAIRAFEYLFSAIQTLDPQSYNETIAKLDALTTQVYNLNISIATLESITASLNNQVNDMLVKLDDIEKSYYDRGIR